MKIFAKKLGMSQIYDDSCKHIAVTVLEIQKTVVVGKRTMERDGYDACIVGRVSKKANNKKSFLGQVKGIDGIAELSEFKGEDTSEFAQKSVIDANIIKEGDLFKVESVSKGKGFSGTVKRHNFATGPKTHGSNNYRRPGSIGPTYPQRVIKGRKMAGKMGAERVTTKNVKVLRVDKEYGRLYVRGPIPGANKTILELSK